jgi:hypothetical protein
MIDEAGLFGFDGAQPFRPASTSLQPFQVTKDYFFRNTANR